MKIKVFKGVFYYKERGKQYLGANDYVYCVYLFGFLIHSVTLTGVEVNEAKIMFGNKIIETEK